MNHSQTDLTHESADARNLCAVSKRQVLTAPRKTGIDFKASREGKFFPGILDLLEK